MYIYTSIGTEHMLHLRAFHIVINSLMATPQYTHLSRHLNLTATMARLFPPPCAQSQILLYLQELILCIHPDLLAGPGHTQTLYFSFVSANENRDTPATVSHNVLLLCSPFLFRPASIRVLVASVDINTYHSLFRNMILLQSSAQIVHNSPCP